MIEGPGLPNPSITEYDYDCNGNLERVWDANHPNDGISPATTTYAYDALDRLTTVTQPWSSGGSVVTSYGYDVQDHLTTVIDAEGNTTNYVYSDRDLMTSEDSPVSGLTSYTYDDHGELISETDARGVMVHRTIDALDRVTFVDFPDSALDIAYTYDDPVVDFSLGRLTEIERDGQTVAYGYDRFGRTTQDGDLSFVYDKNSNRTEIGYPGGVKALYVLLGVLGTWDRVSLTNPRSRANGKEKHFEPGRARRSGLDGVTQGRTGSVDRSSLPSERTDAVSLA